MNCKKSLQTFLIEIYLVISRLCDGSVDQLEDIDRFAVLLVEERFRGSTIRPSEIKRL